MCMLTLSHDSVCPHSMTTLHTRFHAIMHVYLCMCIHIHIFVIRVYIYTYAYVDTYNEACMKLHEYGLYGDIRFVDETCRHI